MRAILLLAAAALAAGLATAPLHAKVVKLDGAWGGPHVGIAFEGGLAELQFDCASGTIDEPVYTSKDGNFVARGTYRAGFPGPVRVGQIYRSERASYSGQVQKDVMTFKVTLEDGTESSQFTLTRGMQPQLTRCL